MDIDFIERFATQLQIKYIAHHPRKGDSWKDCDMEFLNNKLLEEMAEVENSGDFILSRMDELIDMALMAAMCWARESEKYEEAVDRLASKLPDGFTSDPAAHR